MEPALVFRDVTAWAGPFSADADAGPGLAAVDVDDDGDDDLVLPSPRGLLVYTNRGNGSFVGPLVVADSAGGHGVYAADVTGDGHADLFLVDPARVRLFEGRGDGTFAPSARLPELPTDGELSSVTFGDFAYQGQLSVFVGRLGPGHDPMGGGSEPPDGGGGAGSGGEPSEPTGITQLFLARGEDGRFSEGAAAAGLTAVTKVRTASALDLNGDGALDLWVGTDGYRPDLVYLGDTQGRFVEAGASLGIETNTSAMGFDVGDVDSDGQLDLIVADVDPAVRLFIRHGDRYEEEGAARGLGVLQSYSSWGIGLHDFDNDGDLDVLAVNSFGMGEFRDPPPLERVLMENDGAGQFTRREGGVGSGLDASTLARGAAFADFDLDGDVDVAIGSIGAPPQLLRNELGGRHWLEVRLRYPWYAPAVGARVTVRAGGRTFQRVVAATPSYGGTSSGWIHVGLGDAAAVESVEVRWPHGVVQRVDDVGVDRRLTVAYRAP